MAARMSQPSDNGGSRFPHILNLFQDLKLEFPVAVYRGTSIFKIIMIDDVILWSKLESTW